MEMLVFINSALSTSKTRRLNAEIASLIKSEGFDVYLPQEMLPPGSGISSVKILEENEKAIEMCDIVVSILGCSSSFGVGYELAYARAKQKIIILYRRDTRNNLGEIAEGFWNREVRSKRAMNLTQLRDILHSIKEHARSA